MDRRTFWKNKYIKEHAKYLIIGLVICALILFFVGRRAVVKLSPLGWLVIAVLVIAVDLFNFNRRMNEYVRDKLLEEERNEFEISLKIHCAHLAQSVEHAAVNRRVVGSSPTVGATKPLKTLRFQGFHPFFGAIFIPLFFLKIRGSVFLS